MFGFNKEEGKKFSLYAILIGTLVGSLVFVIGSIFVGLAYYFSPLSEQTLPATTAGLFFVSVLIGSASSARWSSSKGLFHALATSLLFFFLFWLLTLILPVNGEDFSITYKLSLAIVAGILGGILGVI